jgi:hypothetical protein
LKELGPINLNRIVARSSHKLLRGVQANTDMLKAISGKLEGSMKHLERATQGRRGSSTAKTNKMAGLLKELPETPAPETPAPVENLCDGDDRRFPAALESGEVGTGLDCSYQSEWHGNVWIPGHGTVYTTQHSQRLLGADAKISTYGGSLSVPPVGL